VKIIQLKSELIEVSLDSSIIDQ